MESPLTRNLTLSFCSLNLAGSKGAPCHYEFKPHLSEYWKIPPHHDAEFVTCMEDVLDVYQRPYDRAYPVICMDESPKQFIGEVRQSLPAKSGSIEKVDNEYVRLGVAELFLAVEPLTGKMVAEVENKRAKKDWAQFIRDLVDVHYPTAKKVILVMDNLNTHKPSSLYEAFDPEEVHRLREKLKLHYTLKHGSWLNIAEIGSPMHSL